VRNAEINDAIARSLSEERLNKYLIAAGSNLDIAIGLYEGNTRLAEAFYTPLQAMEICLRNHLHLQMSEAYGSDWLVAGTAPLHDDAVESVDKAVRSLRRERSEPTNGAVVAELHFGFWIALMGPRYDGTLWREALYRAFRAKGKHLKRGTVHGRFNALRRFRNRIAHHEPIFQSDVARMHLEVLEAIGWMCPATMAWAEHHSRFDEVFGNG
jgi:hypothetical protein